MADSIPSTPNKSFTSVLCKSLLFLLFIVAIPLFSSQAPDFINQTFLTKLWELIHLIFIGVAVSYGLFCRKNNEVDIDFEPQYTTSVDDSQSSLVYRIFHTPSLFEDGFQNLSGVDEKVVLFNGQRANRDESCVIDRSIATAQNVNFSSESMNGFRSYNNGSTEVHFGDTSDVVSQPNYDFHGINPLGLPVRSLNSVIRKTDDCDLSNGSETDSGVNDLSGGSLIEEAFGDGGSVKVEEDGFNERFSLPSQIRWRSKSGRLDSRENEGFYNRPAHFRPLSVDETQFEAFNSHSSQFEAFISHSFRSIRSLSSQASSVSGSPSTLSPLSSVSSEMPSMEAADESGNWKGYRASYPLASQPSSTKKAGDAPLNAFHLRRYSSGSLFRKDAQRSLKDELKDLQERRRQERGEKKEGPPKLLKSDGKPATLVKSLTRGKSVRTIRVSRYAEETTKSGDSIETLAKRIDDEVKRKHEVVKSLLSGKTDTKREGSSSPSLRAGKNLDVQYPLQPQTFTRHQKREIEPNENIFVDSEETSESEAKSSRATQFNAQFLMQQQTFARAQKREVEPVENVFVNSEESSKTNTKNSRVTQARKDMNTVADAADTLSDAGHDPNDPNEVDKKAGEFIARFREQIRLQKVASVERSRGRNLNANNFR